MPVLLYEVIDIPATALEVVDVTPATVEMQQVIAGPPGPAGAGGIQILFNALATWSRVHNMGRPPIVALYDQTGQPFVCGSTYADDTQVIVSLPSAATGRMVLV